MTGNTMNPFHSSVIDDPIRDLPAVSPEASVSFHQNQSALLSLVHNALRIQLPAGNTLDFVQNLQPTFGLTLAATFEFGLYNAFAEELAWTAGIFRSRGIGPDILNRMLNAWIYAMNSTLETVAVRELIRPLEWFEKQAGKIFESSEQDDPRLDADQTAFVQALLDNRKEQALKTAFSVQKKQSLENLIDHLFLASMTYIGRQWSGNRISVAEEHLATSNLLWTAHRFFANCKTEPARKKTMAVTCVPGDAHSLAAEILSQYLEIKGWPVLFLGASMPQEEMLRLLQKRPSHTVIVSVRMVSFLPAFRDLVQRFRELLPEMRILAGGPARIQNVLKRLSDGVPSNFAECLDLLEGGKKRA